MNFTNRQVLKFSNMPAKNQISRPKSYPTSGAKTKMTKCQKLFVVGTISKLLLVVVIAIAGGQHSVALKMINLDAPEVAFHGDSISLSCHFNLESSPTSNSLKQLQSASIDLREESPFMLGKEVANNQIFKSKNRTDNDNQTPSEQLMAIKWYKDDREFYRYVTQDYPRKQVLTNLQDSLFVDLEKSDNFTIILKNVSLRTSGLFKCEVSTEAPLFITKSIERKLIIYSLPNNGPLIEYYLDNDNNDFEPKSNQHNQLSNKYSNQQLMNKPMLYLNSRLELICIASESKPAGKISWLLNDRLNLTTQTQNDQSFADIRKQKFVQLRTSVNKKTPLTTYELLDNGSLVLPSNDSSKPTNISLVDKLNQVLEISASRLNLTINSDLLERLSSAGDLVNEKKSSIMYNVAGFKTKSSKLLGSKQKSNSLDDKFTLRIKCESKVLDLTMTDEIKFQVITHRTRHEDSQQTHKEAQRRLSRIGSVHESKSNSDRLILNYHYIIMTINLIIMISIVF